MLETIASVIAVSALAILPFVLLDITARVFGVDSREMGADDRTR